MNHETLSRTINREGNRPPRLLSPAVQLFFCFAFMGCSSIGDLLPNPLSKETPVAIKDTASLKPTEFDIALRENQAALTDGKHERDTALYNIGVLSSSSANPKRDFGKALSAFRTLVSEYPRSPHAERTRAWIQILDEKQRMAEERRMLARERQDLSQEREKLKYIIEKSGQIDLEIEKRRRQTRTR